MFYIAKTGGFEALLGDTPFKTRGKLRAALASNGCRRALADVAQEYLDAIAANLLPDEPFLTQAATAAVRLYSLSGANDSTISTRSLAARPQQAVSSALTARRYPTQARSTLLACRANGG